MSVDAPMTMTGLFTAHDGLRLVWHAVVPSGVLRGTLGVVHGYGEHSGRYGFLTEALAARGYAVATFDLRGHGRSPGRRGHIGAFSDYLRDTDAFLGQVHQALPGPPIFLLGHSLGGLIAAAYAEDVGDDQRAGRPARQPQEPWRGNEAGLAGLVLSSPFVGMRLRVSPVKISAARLLSRVAPTMSMSNPMRDDQLSHDADVVAAAGADPLNHRVATTRWAVEVLAAQEQVVARADRLRLPLLVLYAGADLIADPDTTRRLACHAGSSDLKSVCYEGYYHEIFNETGRSRVFDDLIGWLDERTHA